MDDRLVYCNRTYLVQLLISFFSFLVNVFFGVLWTMKSSKFEFNNSRDGQSVWTLELRGSTHTLVPTLTPVVEIQQGCFSPKRGVAWCHACGSGRGWARIHADGECERSCTWMSSPADPSKHFLSLLSNLFFSCYCEQIVCLYWLIFGSDPVDTSGRSSST